MLAVAGVRVRVGAGVFCLSFLSLRKEGWWLGLCMCVDGGMLGLT